MLKIRFSIRTRTVATIVSIAVCIVCFGVTAGLLFVDGRTRRAIETDMNVVADIADHFVSGEIRLLKSNLMMVIYRLADGGEVPGALALEGQLGEFPEFAGFSVFDREGGLLVSAGEMPPGREVMGESWLDRAFRGEVVFSTTVKNARGELALYIAAPLGGRVLAAALPGMYFSDMLSSFTIWKSGHIFIDDADGYVIANIRPAWVMNRFNFIVMSQETPRYEALARVVRRMIGGETGIARFAIAGAPRICAFRPVTSSVEGWSLGVVAPLAESPLGNVRGGLVTVGVVSLILSIIAALIAAHFIVLPYEEAARLKDVAEAASKAKSGFLAKMSHEMRTPLNAVIGLSELTLEGLEGEARDNIKRIYGSGVTLLGIVNDILDLSKIESGHFTLVPVEYFLPSLINDTVTFNLIRVGSKPVEFKLQIDGTLPERLYGDDLRVKQIFNNLLSNAFKYTRKGMVEWLVSWERDPEGDGVWLTGVVRDTGIGIKPEDMKRLFTDYSQFDQKNNREIEGTGLGLSIAQKMAAMMEGTITAESEYGKGSSFTVRLRQKAVGGEPIGEEAARSLMAFQYVDAKRSLNNKMIRIKLPYARVLVVDDVSSNLDVARGILKPYGMQVDCVTSGIQAVELVRKEEVKYNAIFMDHMMPEMDGIETVRIIRDEIGTEYAQNVPIIALTANAIIGNEDMFLANGFQEFLSKPIDIVALDTAIRRWVRDKSQENGADFSGEEVDDGEAAGPSFFDGEALPGLDIDEGLKRFSGNGEDYREVLESYAKNTVGILEELREIREEGLPAYLIAVHGLKGSSRNIGAGPLGDQAERLENAARGGDFAFVSAHNGPFIAEMEGFLGALAVFLERIDAKRSRPRKPAPETADLQALYEACTALDIEKIDQTMEELKKYDYDDGADLVEWLKEQVMISAFKKIVERLGKQ